MSRRIPRTIPWWTGGNAVAVTTTLNDWLGSRVTAEGLGFLMNDEMDDFSAKPESRIARIDSRRGQCHWAGKRPLSSMTPTIVVRDGKAFLGVGLAGEFEDYYNRG